MKGHTLYGIMQQLVVTAVMLMFVDSVLCVYMCVKFVCACMVMSVSHISLSLSRSQIASLIGSSSIYFAETASVHVSVSVI